LHRTIVALAIACSACLWPASANAQQLGVKSPGWDYLDPVNIAESRVYARLFFEFKDTGVMSPEFQNFRFTNPAPTGVMTPFYGAEVMFKKIYADRLGRFDPNTRLSYTLSDLLRDDPAVEAAFRLYATTGKLPTPIAVDTTAGTSPLNSIEQQKPIGKGAFDKTPTIRMVGYEGLDPTLRTRDFDRVNSVLKADGGPIGWPFRTVYAPGSLENFPNSAGTLKATTEPVPVYVLVDPAEIDRAWRGSPEHDDAQNAPDKRRFPVLDGPPTSCQVAYFDPTTFQSSYSLLDPPWPRWADDVFISKNRGVGPTITANTRWSAIATTSLRYNNILHPSLVSLGIKHRSFMAYGVSPSVSRIVVPGGVPFEYQTPVPRGDLVFALWESTGLLRDPGSDPWKDQRTGPMSSHVLSTDFDWKVRGRTSFVLPAPFADVLAPRREHVILPESFSKEKVPIISVYADKSSKPLAEDYVFKVGPPTTTVDLLAICLFATCSDEQIRSIPAALRAAEIRNSPPPQPPAPPPPASP
jgi:hypothetical protein